MTIAADAGASCDILVESCNRGESAYNYVSGSARACRSLFGAAFIQELATYPGEEIVQHWTHTKEEMEYSENRKCHKIINVISGYMLTPKLEALHRTIKRYNNNYNIIIESLGDQPTSTPAITSSLQFYNISHLVLTPNIPTAIMNAASDQSCHASTLVSQTNARNFWSECGILRMLQPRDGRLPTTYLTVQISSWRQN